jgi:hypothetical protein
LTPSRHANQRAEASVTSLSKAWQGFKNVVSNITSAPLTNTPQDTLNNATTRRDEAVANPSPIGRNSRGELVQFDSYEEKVKAFEEEVAKAQKAANDFTAGNIPAALKSISTAGDAVVKSIIPQIDQIDKLQAELNKLNDARNTPGVSRSLGHDDAAATAIQNQIAGLKDAQGQAERYNERVAAISTQWGDVGQSTALALQSAQNNLPVLEAVGNGAKMAAQYMADYKNYMDQGKTSTEATALAASNLAAAQAQVNSAAQGTLASLRDQYAVSASINGLQAIQAQAQATYNGLVREGVDASTASATASQQEADARAKASAAVLKQVEALHDNTDMVMAVANGTEAATAAAIAYKNAMEAGASATAAAALSAATLENNLARAAVDTAKTQVSDMQKANTQNGGAIYNAAGALVGISNAWGSDWHGTGGTSSYDPGGFFGNLAPNRTAGTSQGITAAVNSAIANGGIDAAISALKNTKGYAGTIGGPIIASEAAIPVDYSALFSQADALYALKNGQTTDKTVQATNLNDELAFVRSAPETVARDQKINDLMNAIKSLTTSTDSLNGTNQDLLSPYYTQDPRTSHIGFRSQGMATGGELTVPGGYSANDNMLAQIPVASGEIVSVRRPGQNLSGGSSNITINLGGLTVNSGGPADTNAIGRTVYQAMQNATRQLQAAGR